MSLQTQLAGDSRASPKRDARGRYLPGLSGNPQGSRVSRQKVLEKFAELRAVYDPQGSLSALDLNRLELAAKHLLIASKSRDATISVRSTNAAERLLSKIERPTVEPKPVSIDELLRGGR